MHQFWIIQVGIFHLSIEISHSCQYLDRFLLSVYIFFGTGLLFMDVWKKLIMFCFLE